MPVRPKQATLSPLYKANASEFKTAKLNLANNVCCCYCGVCRQRSPTHVRHARLHTEDYIHIANLFLLTVSFLICASLLCVTLVQSTKLTRIALLVLVIHCTLRSCLVRFLAFPALTPSFGARRCGVVRSLSSYFVFFLPASNQALSWLNSRGSPSLELPWSRML